MADQERTPPTPEELAPYFEKLAIGELLEADRRRYVYSATQTNLDRKITLKIVPTDWAQDSEAGKGRFEKEAKVMAKLSHPNIVGIHDFGVVPELEIAYFLMEHVEGNSLKDIKEKIGLKPTQLPKLMEQVCTGLDYAHREGVHHLNIKPANVMVDAEGKVKILDFGLAKLASEAAGGGLSGTPEYAAPEMFGEEPNPDHRSDIYSLGITLYELLTGNTPDDTFPPPSSTVENCPPALDKVIARSIEENPFDRFQSVSELSGAVASSFAKPPKKSRGKAGTKPKIQAGAGRKKPKIRAGAAAEPAKVQVAPKAGAAPPEVDEERLARAAAQGEALKKQAKVTNIAIWCAFTFVALVLAPFIYLMIKKRLNTVVEAPETVVESTPATTPVDTTPKIPQGPRGMIAINNSAGGTPPEGTVIGDWLAGSAWEARAIFRVPPGKHLLAGDAQTILEFGDSSQGVGVFLTLDGETSKLVVAGAVENGKIFLLDLPTEEGKQVKVTLKSTPNPTGTGTIITARSNLDEQVNEYPEPTWVSGEGPDGFGESSPTDVSQIGGAAALGEVSSHTPFGGKLEYYLWAEAAE